MAALRGGAGLALAYDVHHSHDQREVQRASAGVAGMFGQIFYYNEYSYLAVCFPHCIIKVLVATCLLTLSTEWTVVVVEDVYTASAVRLYSVGFIGNKSPLKKVWAFILFSLGVKFVRDIYP